MSRKETPEARNMSAEWQTTHRLQDHCLAAFDAWRPPFQSQFPSVKFDTWSADEGPFPLAEAHRNLTFSATRKTSPDTLDLQFTFSNGPTPPTVHALLLWGDDTGCIESMLSDHPIFTSHPALENIDPILEQFRQKMIECLAFGHPTSEPTQVIISAP